MLTWLHLLFVFLFIRDSWEICDRRPQGATDKRSAVDENFQVLIEGNPKTYIPGQSYNSECKKCIYMFWYFLNNVHLI